MILYIYYIYSSVYSTCFENISEKIEEKEEACGAHISWLRPWGVQRIQIQFEVQRS